MASSFSDRRLVQAHAEIREGGQLMLPAAGDRLGGTSSRCRRRSARKVDQRRLPGS
jgi:hypothetical protein